MKQEIIGTKISKKLASVLGCHVFGKKDFKIKAKTLFSYCGFVFFTAKDAKYWHAYEYKSGMLTVNFGSSEKGVIEETKRKIDSYCKTRAGFYSLVSGNIKKEGFASHAKYSNLLPQKIHTIN